MTDDSRAILLTAYLGLDDQWKKMPSYVELVRRARVFGIAGATVVRGIAGFGPRSGPRRAGILSPPPGAPTIVVMVDAEERIHRFLDGAGDLLAGKLVTVEPVRVVAPVRVRDSTGHGD